VVVVGGALVVVTTGGACLVVVGGTVVVVVGGTVVVVVGGACVVVTGGTGATVGTGVQVLDAMVITCAEGVPGASEMKRASIVKVPVVGSVVCRFSTTLPSAPKGIVVLAGGFAANGGAPGTPVIMPLTTAAEPDTRPVVGSTAHCELTASAVRLEVGLGIRLTVATLAVAPALLLVVARTPVVRTGAPVGGTAAEATLADCGPAGKLLGEIGPMTTKPLPDKPNALVCPPDCAFAGEASTTAVAKAMVVPPATRSRSARRGIRRGRNAVDAQLFTGSLLGL